MCSGLGTKLLANQELFRSTPVDAIAESQVKWRGMPAASPTTTLIAIQYQLTDLMWVNDQKP